MCPFHVYGNWFAHIVSDVVLEVGWLIINFTVAAESQPNAFVKCTVCRPADVKERPFHTKGRLFEHVVAIVVLEVGWPTVNTNVAAESHPAALVK